MFLKGHAKDDFDIALGSHQAAKAARSSYAALAAPELLTTNNEMKSCRQRKVAVAFRDRNRVALTCCLAQYFVQGILDKIWNT